MTDHMSLVRLLSTLLRAVCWPLPPGCEFWCGRVYVTVPSWGPSTARARHQEGYDKEELLRMQATSGKEQEDYEPEQESWQISRLVSTDTFGASHDTGDVWTGRMKIT